MADNLQRIAADGLEIWLHEQEDRQTALEELLDHYNDGRSMSFYCQACARMPIEMIRQVLNQAGEIFVHHKVAAGDVKSKARLVKDAIKDLAHHAHIDLNK